MLSSSSAAAPLPVPTIAPQAASAPSTWPLQLPTSMSSTTALACLVAIALVALVAYLSNPGDVSFQSFLTDLTFREHLRAAQHNLRALTLDSPDDALDASNLPRPPPHMLSFANHLAVSVKTPAYTRYDYRFFSVVIVTRRSMASSAPGQPTLHSRSSEPPPPVSGLLSAIEDRSYWFFGLFGTWYIGTPSWARTFLQDAKRAASFGCAWHQPLNAHEDSWGVIAMENDSLGQDEDDTPPCPKDSLTAPPPVQDASPRGVSPSRPDSSDTCTGAGGGSLKSKSNARRDLDGLARAVEEARAAVAEAESQLAHLTESGSATRDPLQAELDELRRQKKEEDALRGDLKSQMKSLDEAKRTADVDRKEAERQLQSARVIRARRLEQIAEQERALEQLVRPAEASSQRLQACLEERQTRLKSLEQEEAAQRATLAQLQAELAALEEEEATVHQELLEAKRELEEAQAQLASAEQERSVSSIPPLPTASNEVSAGLGSLVHQDLPPARAEPSLELPDSVRSETVAEADRYGMGLHPPQGYEVEVFPPATSAPYYPSPLVRPPLLPSPSGFGEPPRIVAPHPIQPIFPPRVDMEDDIDLDLGMHLNLDHRGSGEHSAQTALFPHQGLITPARPMYPSDDPGVLPFSSASPFSKGLLPSNLLGNLDDDTHANLVSPSRVKDALAQFGVQPPSTTNSADEWMPEQDPHRPALDLDRPPPAFYPRGASMEGGVYASQQFIQSNPSLDGQSDPDESSLLAQPYAAQGHGHDQDQDRVGKASKRWWSNRMFSKDMDGSAPSEVHDASYAGKRRSLLFPRLGQAKAPDTRGRMAGVAISGPIGPPVPLDMSGGMLTDYEAVRRAFQFPLDDEETGRRSWSAFDQWQASHPGLRTGMNLDSHLTHHASARTLLDRPYEPAGRFSSESMPLPGFDPSMSSHSLNLRGAVTSAPLGAHEPVWQAQASRLLGTTPEGQAYPSPTASFFPRKEDALPRASPVLGPTSVDTLAPSMSFAHDGIEGNDEAKSSAEHASLGGASTSTGSAVTPSKLMFWRRSREVF